MKTIIMAGGKGTRVASLYSDIPKSMIPIGGKPVLEHQINCLFQNGLTDIILVVGHLNKAIKDYFGNGKQFGCSIVYYTEADPLGSGGAILKLQNELKDDFFVINGDIIFDLDFSRLIKFHKDKNAIATLAAHPNSHPFDSSLLITDNNACITRWFSKDEERTFYKNLVNAGIHLLSTEIFKKINVNNEFVNLDKDILKPNINTNRLFAYKTPEYIKDMGTIDRIAQVSNDVHKKIPFLRNLKNKQKAIFLDRDGTINIDNGFITKPSQFELANTAGEAVRKINNAGFLAIIITNQPVIARGDCTIEELDTIHQKMETELGKCGAYLDDIYYCPHHPDKGFPGERAEYKIECDCRKPKPGMILKAAEKYNIDLSASFMIGDSTNDIEAGKAAGCKSFLLENAALLQVVEKCLQI